MAVQGRIACSRTLLITPLEAVAVRIILDRPLTLRSLYIPPSTSLRLQELHVLIYQIPAPLLILGVFNACSPL